MSDYLTGAGHFGVGFVAGYIVFALLVLLMKKSLFVRLYSPFTPFLIGAIAAAPYFFVDRFDCTASDWLNVFFLYSILHCQPFAIKFLGDLHVVVVVCGFLYVTIIMYYIHFVKRVRRYGWNRKTRSTKKPAKGSAHHA